MRKGELLENVEWINKVLEKNGSAVSLKVSSRNGHVGVDIFRDTGMLRNLEVGTATECSAAAFMWAFGQMQMLADR